MPSKSEANKQQKRPESLAAKIALKSGDMVMVIAGGNKKKRAIQGQIGKIKGFVGKNKDRVVVEGVNMLTRHKKAASTSQEARKEQFEGSMHVSNVMYYADKIKRPVRLKTKLLPDGSKQRGYVDPSSKDFVSIG
jgi:large subunit ribosomal protein L24